ncbi:Hypothetical Protein FCC1311_032252 [Hondaea fermentalgiana]|uniref:Uncharacterized protein n=1 Tax=Hondaea fermentalgiana TaxID=2315210 RepID=A0A2R5G7H3_9STRA|nr:Hypothetical Protein FCC1311_032252 [Hondaea fermentalgiana]|eukprot:GBG27002.1 Hypothetical Protein FCC1311_032252 [Hondaea fermentalgiana]
MLGDSEQSDYRRVDDLEHGRHHQDAQGNENGNDRDNEHSSDHSKRGKRMNVKDAQRAAKSGGKDLRCLRDVDNLDKLPEQVTSLEQRSDHEVVFHPGDFDGEFVWDSRSHRKNRFPTVNTESDNTYIQRQDLKLLNVEPSNVSWWVAHTFAWGSILFIAQGYYNLFPPESTSKQMILTGVFGFIGSIVFLAGAYAQLLEAINPQPELEFGYRLSKTDYEDYNQMLHQVPRIQKGRKKWRLFALKFEDSGQRAASVQFIGSAMFLFTNTMQLPIFDASDTVIPSTNFILLDVFVYGFRIVSTVCFLYAPIVLMLETQYAWYVPNLGSLGWYSSFFNSIGGLGFLLCAIFGIIVNSNGDTICCQTYGSYLSSFWGSISYLIGSIFMAVEIANKHPLPNPRCLRSFTRPSEDNEKSDDAATASAGNSGARQESGGRGASGSGKPSTTEYSDYDSDSAQTTSSSDASS